MILGPPVAVIFNQQAWNKLKTAGLGRSVTELYKEDVEAS
jgi:hypothetical protein